MFSLKRWFIALVGVVICSNAGASVRIIPATGGEAISADTAANSNFPSWTTLGPITIEEKANGHRTRFNPGTNVTLILRAPTGFEFNTDTNEAPAASFTANRDITAASVVVSATNRLTITLTISGQAARDELVISDVQARPTSVTPLASGNIHRPTGAAGGTAVITGIKRTSALNGGGFNSSNFGTLREVGAAAAALSVSVQPSARAVVGVPFGQQPVIAVVDQYGNVGATLNGLPITATIASGTGVLLGTTTVNVVNGYATFTDLAASAASTITLRFSGGTFAAVTSHEIVVDSTRAPSVLTSLSIVTQPSTTATAGTLFAQQPIVAVHDQYDEVVTTDNSTIVTVVRSAGTGDLQGTLTAQAVAGIVTFANLSHNVANDITLLFTSLDLASAVSDVVQVVPTTASVLAFATQPGDASAGVPFGTQPVVVTQDQFGNNSNIGLSSNLLVTVTLTSGTGPLSGTTTLDIGADDGDGEITFSGLSIATSGTNNQLTATATGLADGVSAVFTVLGTSQTITFDPISDKVFGDAPFEVNASSTSALPITFSITSGPATNSGNVITITGVGDVTVRASQGGDATYDPADFAEQSFTVSKADQTITFGSLTNKIVTDAPFAVSATASSGLPVTISWLSGPATIESNLVTITGVGLVELIASQAGDSNYNAASNLVQSFTVDKANQTINFAQAQLDGKTFGDAPFEISATATSQLAVTLTVVSGPASVSGNVVTITAAGSVTIEASQDGDSNYYAASNVVRTFDVAKANQTITFSEIPDKIYGDLPFALEASASTGLPMTFQILSGPAELTNNIVTITGAGEVIVRSAQGGDTNYNGGVVDQTFEVAQAALLVTADDLSRLQNTANPTLTGSITGVTNGDNITVVYATTAETSSPVGSYPITITLNDPDGRLTNYIATLEEGTLTVQLAMPTIIGQTANVTTNQGASVTLTVDASGDQLTYQWRFKGEDIVGATNSSFTLEHARIHDSGLYEAVVSNGAGSPSSLGTIVDIYIIPGDLDQNGQADVLLQRADGRLAAWYMEGTNIQGKVVLRDGRPLNPGWKIVGEHDFTGDGHADLLLRNVDGRIALWIMDGAQFVSAMLLNDGRPINPAWKVAAVHDFNADDNVDILFKHDDGRLVVRFMNGTTFDGSLVLRDGKPVGAGWKVSGVRDFNGDLKGDIFFRHADGRLAVWFMDGTDLIAKTALRVGPDSETGWKVVGLSDFNHDEKIDLMWQNRFDGRIVVWSLDGTTFIDSSLMRILNPIWKIAGAK